MKKIKTLTLSFLLLFTLSSISFANGLSLNSVGTKALGMGGAFVALSNDATAIYWNPAGLAGQPSSVNLFFTGVMPFGSYKFDMVQVDAKTQSNLYPTGGFFGTMNFNKLSIGLGVYVPAGLGAQWNGAELVAFTGGANLNWESRIGVIAVSPSIAYQITNKFSVGLALNMYYGMFDLDRAAVVPNVGAFQYTEESSGIGFGATIGLKYDVNKKLSVALAFRTKTTVAMSGNAENPAFAGFNAPKSEFDRDVSWPMWIGGGMAYKPTKCLTVAFNGQYSNWSALDKLSTQYKSNVWKGALEPTGDNEFKLDWKNAIQFRLGGEYKINPKTALRLGYYYDPAPAPDETLNILFPSSNNHVVTAGFGYTFGKYSIDASAEYLLGGDRDIKAFPASQNPADWDNMPGIHHLDVFAFSLGLNIGL